MTIRICTVCNLEKEYNPTGTSKHFSKKSKVCRKCAGIKNYRKTKQEQPELLMWRSARTRSVRHSLPFTITVEDVVVPSHCPYLGIPLCYGIGNCQANSPSLDKIIPELGYVKGNIEVISHRANSIKRDLTLNELIRFASHIVQIAAQQNGLPQD